jgi:pyruvate formate lyase activating enzyme
MADGKSGLCRARAAYGGSLYARSYGAAASLALDPIEKKPLYRFHPGSRILSYGSYGCNMRCAWCQNASIAQCSPPSNAPRVKPGELAQQAIVAARCYTQDERENPSVPFGDTSPVRGGFLGDGIQPPIEQENIGVAFTYNEPLVSPEFILDVAPLLRASGLAVVLVTNAMINDEPFADILPHADAMNIDLKGFTEGVYERCGGRLAAVKRNIRAAAERPSCHIEITTLIVPGENDSEEEMCAEAEWLAAIDPDIPLHITRFFPAYKARDKAPTPTKTILSLVGVAERYLKYVYPGNI